MNQYLAMLVTDRIVRAPETSTRSVKKENVVEARVMLVGASLSMSLLGPTPASVMRKLCDRTRNTSSQNSVEGRHRVTVPSSVYTDGVRLILR